MCEQAWNVQGGSYAPVAIGGSYTPDDLPAPACRMGVGRSVKSVKRAGGL